MFYIGWLIFCRSTVDCRYCTTNYFLDDFKETELKILTAKVYSIKTHTTSFPVLENVNFATLFS